VLLCDDEKAYQAYMTYHDADARQGEEPDPDKAMDAPLDALVAPTDSRAATIRPKTRPTTRALSFFLQPG